MCESLRFFCIHVLLKHCWKRRNHTHASAHTRLVWLGSVVQTSLIHWEMRWISILWDYISLALLSRMGQRKKKLTIRRATKEDSDKPAHPCSLIRVLTDHMCLIQPPNYPKRCKRKPLPSWVIVEADLSLSWSHRSYCRFHHDLAQKRPCII